MAEILTSDNLENLSLSQSSGDDGTLVVVHPFFRDRVFSSGFVQLGMYKYMRFDRTDPVADFLVSGNDYREKVINLVNDHQGKVILFEENRKIDYSLCYFNRSSERNDFVVVPTEVGNPKPLGNSWHEVINFASSLKGETYFAGGQIFDGSDEKDRNLYGGCLGATFERFKAAGIRGKFVEGCCYDFDFLD